MLGETLQAAVALRSRIGERVGLCLEDEHPPDARLGDQASTTGDRGHAWGPDRGPPHAAVPQPHVFAACSTSSG